jgi:hypothetical protein
VEIFGVAIRAGNLVFTVQRNRNGPATDIVILRLVAVDTLEIVPAHMDIQAGGGEIQGLVHVAMFDGVPTAPVEMACAAVLTGRPAHAFCRLQEIHTLYRYAAAPFNVTAGLIVASQAVYILLDGKIKIRIHPAVSGMARGTGRPIRLDTQAEIIEGILFSDRDRLLAAFQHVRLALPRPVDCGHQVLGSLLVAFQTSACYFRSGVKGTFEQSTMIGVRRFNRDHCPGIIGCPGLRRNKQDDRHRDQHKREEQADGPNVFRAFDFVENRHPLSYYSSGSSKRLAR